MMDYKYAIAILGEVDSPDVWNDITDKAPFDAYITTSGWLMMRDSEDGSMDLCAFARSRWFATEFYMITRLREG